MRYTELSMNAQTAYAELVDQVLAQEMHHALAGLPGSFHRRTMKGRDYWYFGYRDIDGRGRMAYIGPDAARVRGLVERFRARSDPPPCLPQARAALALGCTGLLPKHFRIIRRLADYGLFRAGGMLIGTHAFVSCGNLLGVRWQEGQKTMDVDFAHAGRNVSVALPADLRIDVRSALESLEMGLLPILQFNGRTGAQYRNPDDPELRLDFVTCEHRGGGTVELPDLNLALEPLRFMEFLLQAPIQACVFGQDGACIVNLPAPERFAVHKLIVYGERPLTERTKANKDLLQAAALIACLCACGQRDALAAAFDDAESRGRNWQRRLNEGRQALVQRAPDLAGIDVLRTA